MSGFTHKSLAIGMIGSVLILLLILSVAKGKAPNYFLIAVAPLSVFAGWWLAEFSREEQKKQQPLLLFYLVFAGLYTLFLVFAVWFSGGRALVLPLIVLLISGLCLLFVIQSKENKFSRLIAFLVFISAGLNLFLNTKVFPELAAYQGARQVLKIFEAKNNPDAHLFDFEVEEYNLFFYSTQNAEHLETWDDLYEVMEKPGSWVYTNEIKYKDIILMNYAIDTVYQIKQRGLNEVNFEFLNPVTRVKSLKTNYLIVTGDKKK